MSGIIFAGKRVEKQYNFLYIEISDYMNVMGSHNRLSENISPLVSAITTCRLGFINLTSFVMEKWKTIEQVDTDRYEVSNHGRLRSWAVYGGKKGAWDDSPRILSQYTHRSGHKMVGLKIGGDVKQLRVHRLVAKAFIPNPNNYPFVLHDDDDPENNHVDNLKWGNDKINQADRRRNNGHHNEGEYHGYSVLTNKEVRKIKKLVYNTDLYYKEIAEKFDVNEATVRAIKDGKSWNHIQIKEEKNGKDIPSRAHRKFRGGHHMASKVIHEPTGREFDCIKDAAEWADVVYGTLVTRINKRPHLTDFKKLESV